MKNRVLIVTFFSISSIAGSAAMITPLLSRDRLVGRRARAGEGGEKWKRKIKFPNGDRRVDVIRRAYIIVYQNYICV
jgi:hypothetical protein